MTGDIGLRPPTIQDRAFLWALHGHTMRALIDHTWGWDEVWQRRDFDRRLTAATVSVIVSEGRAIGGLFLTDHRDAVDIHDRQIAPEYQGRGIGTGVIRQVVDRAARDGRAVTLSVLEANPRARALYERLGFHTTGAEPPFIYMRRDP